MISLTPTAAFPATDIQFASRLREHVSRGRASRREHAPAHVDQRARPDIVALAATVTNDGIANIPPGVFGTGFFSVATVNVGASASDHRLC